MLPAGLTRVPDIAVDGRVLMVTVSVAGLCGLVFSSAPAWLAGRNDLVGLMKTGGGAVIGGQRRNRLLSVFLVADVAFVCVLLVATALVITSFILVTTADLGFDRRNVMTFPYERALQEVNEADRSAAAAVLRTELLNRARSVPGVISAAIATNASTPLSGGSVRYSIDIPGFGQTTREDWPETRMVTPDYFRVLGMQLIRGRMFEPSDGAGAPRVMLINDVAARRFFPDRDPIGEVVTFRGPTTIIGVLRGVRMNGPEVEMRPEMYTLADQVEPRYQRAGGHLVVRADRDPRSLAAAVREAIRPALDAEPPQPQFVDDDFRRLTAGRRFNAGLMAAFGLIAVAIGAIGVYGTMEFVVAQQVRSIGLRMALGASTSHVMRSVLRDAMRRVMLGTVIGLGGAWLVSRAFTSFVFGIRPTEPALYMSVGGLLALVGLAAALVPALHAARLDPLVSLRHE
jgi:predicted permease